MDQTPGSVIDDLRLPPGKLDVDEYYRLAREGVFGENARVELIEGELVWMNAIGSPHASAVKSLNHLLAPAVGRRALVSVQDPIRLDDASEPQPDVALLVPRADRYRRGHPSAGDVLLLIEVADTSLAYDRGPKRALYSRYGIREYWVVDIEGVQVDVCRNPGPAGYANIKQAGLDDVLTVAALPDISVRVRDILG